MMRILIAGLLMLVAGIAHGQTTCNVASSVPCAWNEDCLTWSRPTTYSDGTALTATDVGTYIVEAAAVGSTAWTQVGTVTAPVQGYKRAGLKHGDAFQYRVSAVLKSGARSVPSNVCNLTTTETTPSPPVLSTTDTVAFEIKPNTSGVLSATRVGYVPLGTGCDGTRSQKIGTVTYSPVPRNSIDMVNWPSKVGLTEIWAKCG